MAFERHRKREKRACVCVCVYTDKHPCSCGTRAAQKCSLLTLQTRLGSPVTNQSSLKILRPKRNFGWRYESQTTKHEKEKNTNRPKHARKWRKKKIIECCCLTWRDRGCIWAVWIMSSRLASSCSLRMSIASHDDDWSAPATTAAADANSSLMFSSSESWSSLK